MTRTATLFTNGNLFDGCTYLGAGEVAIADGLIAEVRMGPDGVDRSKYELEEVIDLDGGLISPGFVDAHVHAVQGGLERLRCDLTPGHAKDDYLRIISEYAQTHPDASWILGGGWAMSEFPAGNPAAELLDTVVSDRPVFLPNRDHHSAWVNTKALQLAGIDRETRDPVDGRLERDADGNPTGTLHEGAMKLVSRFTLETTDAEYYEAFLEGQRHLHSLGITGWQDAIIGAYAGMGDPGPTYRLAAERGDLTAYVVGALWWDRSRGTEQIADLLASRSEYSYGRFRASSVKIMQDGVAENFTAAMLTPYLDRCGHATDNTGHSFIAAEALRGIVGRLDAEGFQVHVHAIGDRGVREALDAFVGTDSTNRHHIAHLQLVHPADIARFAELGVAANMQMLWACYDDQMVDLTLPFIGEERAGWQYPFGDLGRAGVKLVGGSDWPVSSADPVAAIHVGVNRTAYGEPRRVGSQPFLPEQSLALEAAMAAYVSGSSWINHRDVDAGAGRLHEGSVADLVTLDRDPFAEPVADIGAAAATSTWVDGEAVYRR